VQKTVKVGGGGVSTGETMWAVGELEWSALMNTLDREVRVEIYKRYVVIISIGVLYWLRLSWSILTSKLTTSSNHPLDMANFNSFSYSLIIRNICAPVICILCENIFIRLLFVYDSF
jgi:hypothetical protein